MTANMHIGGVGMKRQCANCEWCRSSVFREADPFGDPCMAMKSRTKELGGRLACDWWERVRIDRLKARRLVGQMELTEGGRLLGLSAGSGRT